MTPTTVGLGDKGTSRPRIGTRRQASLYFIAVISALALGGAIGWVVKPPRAQVKPGLAQQPIVLLPKIGGIADSFTVDITRPGTIEAEWSSAAGQGESPAILVPPTLACYVTFGNGRVVQSTPSTIIEFDVKAVRHPVVVAFGLTIGGTGLAPFAVENGSLGLGSDGFSLLPDTGC
jgi:hypothetical protein